MPFRRFACCLLATYLIASGAQAASPCAEYAAKLPNVKREFCDAAQLQPSGARSVNGQALWVRDIKPDNASLRVLVVGAIHGDELSSGAVALHWIRLAAQPQDAPQAIHWRFVPVLNPDGVLSRPPRRVNAHGVDLNRNFPTPNWERDARVYWEKRTGKDPRRWPGPKPLSEPESRFLHEQMQSFKPQLIVSIHAPYGVLDFDGPSVPPSRLGRLYLDQVGIFPGLAGQLRRHPQRRAGRDHRTAQFHAHAARRRDAPDVAGPAALDERAGDRAERGTHAARALERS
jgi:protein MpaA